ncbi:MAG: discoidin domain-containing protein [Patescibacteria group bacterium]
MYNWNTKNTISKVCNLINKYFIAVLLLLVIVSYGQLVFMQTWEDDNALFFKLANIEGPAGYLGAGALGQGVYKYTATPYIPIYALFGNNAAAYFVLAIIFYFLATLSIYKTFSEILGKRAGKIAGFLYGTGYIASDSFIRLFNTIVTSFSVITMSFFTLFYWRFSKDKKLRWYLLALSIFFLATEFSRARTHYLIVIVVVFEFLFFLKKKQLFLSIRNSLLRLMPFAYIFYRYFVVGADSRSGKLKEFFYALQRGEFYKLYGWFSSITNVVLPSWFTDPLFNLQSILTKLLSISFPYVRLIVLLSFVFSVYLLLKGRKKRKIWTLAFLAILIVWIFISKQIFVSPALNIGEREIFIAFLGGVILLIGLVVSFIIPVKYRTLYIFFGFWLLVNIGVYSAYNPTMSHNSIHRYLAHSFFALVAILSIFSASLSDKRNKLSKFVLFSIIFWGLGNLVSGVIYQKNIVETRSNPPKYFYKSLKSYLPEIKRGDVIYFDVAQNAQRYFRDAFSVAQMPEETAIAWRYGLDRYDLRRVIKLEDLVTLYREGSFTDKDKKTIPLNKIYTFFYSADGLFDTTEETWDLFENGGREETVFLGKLENKNELIIPLTKSIKSIVPTEIKINLSSTSQYPNELSFPYIMNAQMGRNSIAKTEEYRKLALEYKKTMENIFSRTSVETNSDWQENVYENIIDRNTETFWRAHRILWITQGATLTLDLKKVSQINRFVWVNVWPGSTPTEYIIQISKDGTYWQDVKKVSNFKRIDTKDPQVEDFLPQEARFVRMTITKTLNSDSPGIAEAWVVPIEFSKLDIKETEDFLADPFGYVPDIKSYNNTLSELGFLGTVQVYWRSNKSGSFVTDAKHTIKAVYDGASRQYKIVLPAGGTEIDSLKLVGSQIPGNLTLTGITAKQLSIKEVSK